jgi:hypothetical protein
MITKISSTGIDRVQSTPFAMAFVSIPLIIGIIIQIIKAQFEIATALFVMLSFCAIGFVVSMYLLRYLRDAYIDDEYLYISHDKKQTKILLKDIQNLDYHWYPVYFLEESWIEIKYLGKNNKIEKVLIIPTQLDKNKNLDFNKKIIWLIKEKMDKFKEKTKTSKQ